MNKQHIPASIAVMMRTRGYKGEMPIGYHEAQMWLLEKYNAWLEISPMYLEVIGKFGCSEQLAWVLEARAVDSKMDCDGYCEYYNIDDEFNHPVANDLSEAGIEVLETVLPATERAYNTPEDAIGAGLINVMKLLDE